LLYTTETGDASPSRDDLTVNSVSPYMIAPNAYLTPAQEDKVEEIVQAINSDIPIHVTIMSKSHVNREHVKFVSTMFHLKIYHSFGQIISVQLLNPNY
jgi:hypothetical protein